MARMDHRNAVEHHNHQTGQDQPDQRQVEQAPGAGVGLEDDRVQAQAQAMRGSTELTNIVFTRNVRSAGLGHRNLRHPYIVVDRRRGVAHPGSKRPYRTRVLPGRRCSIDGITSTVLSYGDRA